jgi:general secretion pathway protein K
MKPLANKGAALITALFIMAIVVIIATGLIVRLHIDIERTDLFLTKDKFYLAAQGAKYWAIGLLNEKSKVFPQQFGPIYYGNMIVSGELIDAQSLFNLNNMQASARKGNFILLLKAVLPSIENEKAEQLANSLIYWFSTMELDQNIEDSYLKSGYRISHLPMSSSSELRLVQGFSQEIYNALAPFVIVLPKQTRVNISSAPIPVLMSLGNGLSKDQAEQIIHAREDAQDKSFEKNYMDEIINKFNITDREITMTSNYFLLRAKVVNNKQEFTLYCLLQRIEHDHVQQVDIIWQRNAL